jgi:hypothetical protein
MSGAAGPPTAIVHPQRGNRTGQCFKRRTIELNLCVRRDWYFQNCFLKPSQPRSTPLQQPAKFQLREQALCGLAGQVVRTLRLIRRPSSCNPCRLRQRSRTRPSLPRRLRAPSSQPLRCSVAPAGKNSLADRHAPASRQGALARRSEQVSSRPDLERESTCTPT